MRRVAINERTRYFHFGGAVAVPGTQRFVVVGDTRIDTTHCSWCGDGFICSVHSAEAALVRGGK